MHEIGFEVDRDGDDSSDNGSDGNGKGDDESIISEPPSTLQCVFNIHYSIHEFVEGSVQARYSHFRVMSLTSVLARGTRGLSRMSILRRPDNTSAMSSCHDICISE